MGWDKIYLNSEKNKKTSIAPINNTLRSVNILL